MKEIALDGTSWETEEDFYKAFLPALGAPDWHGHNLDALNDTIGGGDINQTNPPFTVCITGVGKMGSEAKHVVERFRVLVADLKRDGVVIELRITD